MTDEPGKQPTIWVTPCPMKKSGFPSVGNFGARIDNVVIMRLETWNALCREIPALGAKQFNVGTQE